MDRNARFELLAIAAAEPLMTLAEEVLGTATVAIPAQPSVGTLMLRLRDPVTGETFNAGEVVVTEARAMVGDHRGYAVRLGRDPAATLAAAVLDAAVEVGLPHVPHILHLLAATDADARAQERAAWCAVAPTRLRFGADTEAGHLAADIPGVHDDAAMDAVDTLLARRHGMGGPIPALIDLVMSEGGLYAPDLAQLAVAQAEGDPTEAAFLLRAYRTTLLRLGNTFPADGRDLRPLRRLSPIYKELTGGQVLGLTRDYTQRLLDVGIVSAHKQARTTSTDANGVAPLMTQETNGDDPANQFPRVVEMLRAEGLISSPTATDAEPFDVTRRPLRFPAPRSARLQTLARGETGFLVGMAYSVMRGFGAAHPLIAELRQGNLSIRVRHPDTDTAVSVGIIALVEVDTISYAPGILGAKTARQAAEATAGRYFHQGYGVAFGTNERKAIAMAVLDLNLNTPGNAGPAASEEFVLSLCDGVAASGLVEHLKLPHYVSFQSVLDRVRFRRLAAVAEEANSDGAARVEATAVGGGVR